MKPVGVAVVMTWRVLLWNMARLCGEGTEQKEQHPCAKGGLQKNANAFLSQGLLLWAPAVPYPTSKNARSTK